MISILCRLWFILLALVLFCSNTSLSSSEKEFYKMSFDSLFVIFSGISSTGTLPQLTAHMNETTDDFTALSERFSSLSRKKAKNQEELTRLSTIFRCATAVLYSSFQYYVSQYLEEYDRIDSTIWEYRKFVGGYGYLFQEQEVEIKKLQAEKKKLEKFTIERFQNFSSYLNSKTDSLRLLGWNNYLEWRKFNSGK